jgi:hypothetical protein
MHTADPTVLPPPSSSSAAAAAAAGAALSGDGSVRHLDAIGIETILGAMIVQRRASQPSFASVRAPDPTGDAVSGSELLDEEDDGPATHRAPTRSEIFVKAR